MRNPSFMKSSQPQQSLLHNPLRQHSGKSFVEGMRVEIIGYTRSQQLQHKTFVPSIGPTDLEKILHHHQILVTRLVCVVCCSRESLQNRRFSIRTFWVWLRYRYLDSNIRPISIARQSAQSNTEREKEKKRPNIPRSPHGRITPPTQFMQNAIFSSLGTLETISQMNRMIATSLVAMERFGINVTAMCRPP